MATDARRREVYWARYGAGGVRIDGPHVGRAVEIPQRGVPTAGAGADRYPEAFAERRGPEYPDPGVLARLVAVLLETGAPPDVEPLYLRRPDAVAPATRKRVSPA